jgi:hypothetical protein
MRVGGVVQVGEEHQVERPARRSGGLADGLFDTQATGTAVILPS